MLRSTTSELRRVLQASDSEDGSLPRPTSDRSKGRRQRKLSLGEAPSRPRRLSSVLRSRRCRLALFGVVVVVVVLRWALADVILLASFKVANYLDTKGYRTSLRLRKPPLLFVHSSSSAAVVWESNHLATDGNERLALRWRDAASRSWTDATVRTERPEREEGWRRWIHSTVLEALEPGVSYRYEIFLDPPHLDPPRRKVRQKVLVGRTFTWIGLESPARASPPTVHLACVGDNQFALTVFARVVARLAKLSHYLPSSSGPYSARLPTPPPKQPHLLVHVGDAVQNPHDLDQWQTDFWDPLTRGPVPASFSGGVPILYARGNHDFDPDGRTLYTAGLPKAQEGELNRTASVSLPRSSMFHVPATAEGDEGYLLREPSERAEGDRSTFHSYSPHPRCRIIVLDTNLEEGRLAPGARAGGQSEVDEQERWLVWEMGRREWRDASIRIVVVHVPPFVERWDRNAWTEGGESEWALYVRTRLAPHFHGMSYITRKYDIPPASLVMSGHSHTYARGLLGHYAARELFTPFGSSSLSDEARHAARSGRSAQGPVDEGVVYTILGGAGGTFDVQRVERWWFYERSVTSRYHFIHVTLDFAASSDPAQEDKRRAAWEKDGTRVYRLPGSQMPCSGGSGVDRLLWTALDLRYRVLDRFIIEASQCT